MESNFGTENKLWGMLEPKLTNAIHHPIGSDILNLILKQGSKVAQTIDDNGVTYFKIWQNTISAAKNLQNRGIQARETFVFMASKCDHLLSIFLASICLECPVCPLNPYLAIEQTVRVLIKVKPTVVFCDISAYDQMKSALNELKYNPKLFILDADVPDDDVETVTNLFITTADENTFRPIAYDVEKDVAIYLCSSGTTGPSKCVCLPYNNSAFSFRFNFDEDSVVYSCSSFYWSVGFRAIFDSIYNGGTRIITAKTPTPSLILNLINKYQVNVVYTTIFNVIESLKIDKISEVNLSSVKLMLTFNGDLPRALMPEFKRHFTATKLISLYGMSELGLITASTFDDEKVAKTAHPNKGYLAKIVDENGRRCGPNVSGELRVKVNSQFMGYLGDPETSASFSDEEGFYRTGDIGRFDENGSLFIEGRKKNVMDLFYFSMPFIPSEIEDYLISISSVNEVCVVGIYIGDKEYLPAAVIVRNPSHNVTVNDIYKAVEVKLPYRLRLRGGVYFVDSLPKTNGKPLRGKITEIVAGKFQQIKFTDPVIQSYLLDFPEEYRRSILNK